MDELDVGRTLKGCLFSLIGSHQNPVPNPITSDAEYGGVLVNTPDGPKRAYLRLCFEPAGRQVDGGGDA
jgi:hypothetical protein